MTKFVQDNELFFSMTFEFLEIYLTKQVGSSPCTVKSYKDSLTLLRKYLLEELEISISKFTFEQCDRELVMGFLDYISKRGCSNSTKNKRLTAIKSYLRFAADKDISLQSIALRIGKISESNVAEPLRLCLSDQAVNAILSQPDTSKLMGIRDSALMSLLYDSATRLAELLSLTIGNIVLDGDSSYIRVMGKGSKERVISICANAASQMDRYFKRFRDKDAPFTDLVFYTKVKGNIGTMTERNVERLIQNYADKAREHFLDIPDRVHPHMFRRSRATNMYQNGVALPVISRILGHAHLETTKIYATPSIEMMKEAMTLTGLKGDPEEIPIWESEDDMAAKSGLR